MEIPVESGNKLQGAGCNEDRGYVANRMVAALESGVLESQEEICDWREIFMVSFCERLSSSITQIRDAKAMQVAAMQIYTDLVVAREAIAPVGLGD